MDHLSPNHLSTDLQKVHFLKCRLSDPYCAGILSPESKQIKFLKIFYLIPSYFCDSEAYLWITAQSDSW